MSRTTSAPRPWNTPKRALGGRLYSSAKTPRSTWTRHLATQRETSGGGKLQNQGKWTSDVKQILQSWRSKTFGYFHRYYGDNYEWLVDLKRRWDPDNVFHHCQSIGSTDEDCCPQRTWSVVVFLTLFTLTAYNQKCKSRIKESTLLHLGVWIHGTLIPTCNFIVRIKDRF